MTSLRSNSCTNLSLENPLIILKYTFLSSQLYDSQSGSCVLRAPAFICRDRPREEVKTLAPHSRATSEVRSWDSAKGFVGFSMIVLAGSLIRVLGTLNPKPCSGLGCSRVAFRDFLRSVSLLGPLPSSVEGGYTLGGLPTMQR